MFTQKRIVSILVTAGVVSFLIGLIFASQASDDSPVSWQIQSLLILSIISTGMGCYLAGSISCRNKRYRFTMDFSKSK